MNKETKKYPEHTLIINYAGLMPGGIEKYFVNLMRHSLEKYYRVIWLTTPSCVKNCFYKDISENPLIEKVYIKMGWHWNLHAEIAFNKEEKVTMLSCEPLNYMKAEKIRKKAVVSEFNHFLLLPHFTGNAYYPERYFGFRPLKKAVFRFMKKNVEKWNNNNCIFAFSLKHLECYEDNYGIEITDKNDKVLRNNDKVISFDQFDISQKSAKRHNKFIIVSCSRFDFPHKGYLLGLVDAFAVLKQKNPQLRLIIIGYGNGECQLRGKIDKLSPDIKDDIILTGALDLEKIREVFYKGHLNIGLAGALLDGALCGVPSLLVRHYTEKCETYGFIHNVEGNLLKDTVGDEIIPYIQKVIDMNDEEYVTHCENDYRCAKLRRKNDPDFIYKNKNLNNTRDNTKFSVIKGAIINFMCYIEIRLFKKTGYDQ